MRCSALFGILFLCCEPGDNCQQPFPLCFLHELWTGTDRHEVRSWPASGPTGSMTEAPSKVRPCIIAQPHGRRINGFLNKPMHAAFRPEPHRVIHKVCYVCSLSLIHHVVMLINVQDVGRHRQPTFTNASSPLCECMIVPLDYESYRTTCPNEQLL